jgi:hypothetical protein
MDPRCQISMIPSWNRGAQGRWLFGSSIEWELVGARMLQPQRSIVDDTDRGCAENLII